MTFFGKIHHFSLILGIKFANFKKKTYFCTRFCDIDFIIRFYEHITRRSKRLNKGLYGLYRIRVSLAQLVEQLTLNQWVEGSSPSGDTKLKINELQNQKLVDFFVN